MGAVKKPRLKPETINMRGAAVRSLSVAFAHYRDWQTAVAQDLGDSTKADAETFLDWVADELKVDRSL